MFRFKFLRALVLAAPLCALASESDYSELSFKEPGHGHDHDHSQCMASKLQPAFTPESKLDLSLIGTLAFGSSTGEPKDLQAGGHDPVNKGLNLQSLELVLRGNFSPYLNALAVVLTGIDPDDEAFVEIEEAWLQANAKKVSIRAGQLMTQFGRSNPTHLHQWAFVDSPLVNVRMLGEDGLRSPGVQAGWEMPTPFESELILSAQDVQENHEHSEEADHLEGAGLMQGALYTARYVVAHELGGTQTVSAGFSAALGNNDFGKQCQSRLLGLDFSWRWQLAGQRFVGWQSEFISRAAEASAEEDHQEHGADGDAPHLMDQRFDDWGLNSQLLWGFRPKWSAGLRADYVQAEKLIAAQERWRISPNLTWIPTDWCKVRLQYNFDHSPAGGEDHSVWLQMSFFAGAHKAH